MHIIIFFSFMCPIQNISISNDDKMDKFKSSPSF